MSFHNVALKDISKVIKAAEAKAIEDKKEEMERLDRISDDIKALEEVFKKSSLEEYYFYDEILGHDTEGQVHEEVVFFSKKRGRIIYQGLRQDFGANEWMEEFCRPLIEVEKDKRVKLFNKILKDIVVKTNELSNN